MTHATKTLTSSASDYLSGWSELEAPLGGGVDKLLVDPFSAGGGFPHFLSDSKGSNT